MHGLPAERIDTLESQQAARALSRETPRIKMDV